MEITMTYEKYPNDPKEGRKENKVCKKQNE